jgi:hypothetical protein
MLYQLSYASAAQTEQSYQKRNENCKEGFENSSTSVARAVGIASYHAHADKSYLASFLQVRASFDNCNLTCLVR